jgi:chorismate mutase
MIFEGGLMAKKRELELHMLRFLPHPLRDDFVTVGLLLLESDGGFAEVRFTRDWTMLRYLAPDVDLEWFEMVESEIRGRLGTLRQREDLVQLVNERFGTIIDVAPTKAVQTEDPAKELEVLTSMYLVPMKRGERVQPRVGRVAIVSTIKEEFTKAGVLELLQRDLDVEKYTGQGDPFRIDFGYRVGGMVKMFHAVSVASNVDQALALLYRYSCVATGMRQEGLKVSLTAVVDEESALEEEKTQFAVGMLKQHSVRVKPVEKVAEIAREVRRDAMIVRLERSEVAGLRA